MKIDSKNGTTIEAEYFNPAMMITIDAKATIVLYTDDLAIFNNRLAKSKSEAEAFI